MSGRQNPLVHEHVPAWWETATVPRGFSHGGLCRECASDVHDEHYGQATCSVAGCTCDEGMGDD